jgi:hypothetical protein
VTYLQGPLLSFTVRIHTVLRYRRYGLLPSIHVTAVTSSGEALGSNAGKAGVRRRRRVVLTEGSLGACHEQLPVPDSARAALLSNHQVAPSVSTRYLPHTKVCEASRFCPCFEGANGRTCSDIVW